MECRWLESVGSKLCCTFVALQVSAAWYLKTGPVELGVLAKDFAKQLAQTKALLYQLTKAM